MYPYHHAYIFDEPIYPYLIKFIIFIFNIFRSINLLFGQCGSCFIIRGLNAINYCYKMYQNLTSFFHLVIMQFSESGVDQIFFKMGHSRPLFLYFRLFYKQLTVNKCSIKVADDWIRTRVLWYRKRPLCQLRHNHCPGPCMFTYNL